MTIKRLIAVFLLVSAFAACGAESTNRLKFSEAGFSIAPLEVAPGDSVQLALTMSLPAADNFSGNVNVQIQPYTGTIDEYAALSLKQFQEHKLKIIAKKKVGTSVLALEYAGEMSGRSLHWYYRAEKSGDHAYLATATTTETSWADQSTALKTCVNSFRCNPALSVDRPRR